MGRILRATMVLWLALSGAAAAGENGPVVVELYTSQGCSACPPADEALRKLAARQDVIALALHVDYWDYIGWKDTFGNPAFTKRQKAYARANGDHTIYTPQMIVQGSGKVVGYRPMELAELIQKNITTSSPVTLRMERQGARLTVIATAETALPGEAVLQLVRYLPEEKVSIKRGENAGRTITYANIVTEWTPVARWDGRAPFRRSFDVEGSAPVVAIMQESGPGRILAAAQLR